MFPVSQNNVTQLRGPRSVGSRIKPGFNLTFVDADVYLHGPITFQERKACVKSCLKTMLVVLLLPWVQYHFKRVMTVLSADSVSFPISSVSWLKGERQKHCVVVSYAANHTAGKDHMFVLGPSESSVHRCAFWAAQTGHVVFYNVTSKLYKVATNSIHSFTVQTSAAIIINLQNELQLISWWQNKKCS